MIKVEYGTKFLKDLSKIKKLKVYDEIKNFCFINLTEYTQLVEINNLKKIVGHKSYFRIRIGDYRIGLKFDNNTIFLMRVLHRKEIYKYFP